MHSLNSYSSSNNCHFLPESFIPLFLYASLLLQFFLPGLSYCYGWCCLLFEQQKSSIFFFFFGLDFSTSLPKSSSIIFFLLLRFLHQSLSLCFLKRFFTFPISTFKLLVKNVRHTCGFYYCILSMIPSTVHVGFTSPHLSFSYLLSILY